MPKNQVVFSFQCMFFVCRKMFNKSELSYNSTINLAVCNQGKETEKEKLKVKEYLDSMISGFSVGCIS